MAHFAKLDHNNFVIQVHSVNNDAIDATNEEASGIEFLTQWSGGYTNWKQTSYNESIRYNYAGIGYFYDEVADAFIAPEPSCGHSELTLNTSTYKWECSNSDHEPIF
jgi:hypothetical protein